MVIAQPLTKGGKQSMKRIIVIMVMLILMLSSCSVVSTALAYSVEFDAETSFTYNDLDQLEALMQEQDEMMEAAHQMAEAARSLGYKEQHDVIQLAKQEWHEADELKAKYQAIYDDLMEHWKQKEEEYPDATYVWSYFKDLGYNDYVCAGILGNMMVECGGHTLALQPTVSTRSYYGICQWSKGYSDVWNTSLEEQCNFLRDTIEYEFNTYGSLYKKNFDYASFLELEDYEQAALAFAEVYERCSSASFSARKKMR